MKKIGFAGLGIMGSGMAANMIRKGFEVTVWNRDAGRCAPLAAAGARVARTPAEMASQAEVVITMVRDDAAVRAVLSGPEGAFEKAQKGTCFIDMSTVTPGLARAMAQEANKRGFSYLDAPVTGSKGAAAEGKLNILVGGPVEILEEQREVLEAMSQSIAHLGPNGASAYFKLANNQIAAVLMAALGESLALIEQAGIDRQWGIETLAGTVTRVMGLKKEKIQHEDWSTDFALDLMYKDINQALIAAEELKHPQPIVAAAREVYQRGRQANLGSKDFSAVSEVSRIQKVTPEN